MSHEAEHRPSVEANLRAMLKENERLLSDVARLQAELAALKVAEQELSDSYLRMRRLVNAFDTKPGGVDRFEVTENCVKALLSRAENAESALSEAQRERDEAMTAHQATARALVEACSERDNLSDVVRQMAETQR